MKTNSQQSELPRVRYGTPRLFAVVFILIGVATYIDARTITNVRTGHDGHIEAIVAIDGGETLVTGGRDGKVIVWDVETEQLLQSIHADILPIRRIVPYSDGERFAVYASDGQTHRITVWNWRTGERSFLHTPEDEVLHMDVSQQGSYVIYSVPRLRSIRIIDGRTGRELPFLRENTGIVSWFVIARSEERVMTYTPGTGEIVYRSIVTDREAGRFVGPSDLSHLAILPSPRFASAVTAEGLLGIVDLLSGTVVSETVAGEIQQIEIDRESGEIVVVSLDFGGAPGIRRFQFDDNERTLQRRYTTQRRLPDTADNLFFVGRDIFAADEDGALLRWLPFELRPQKMAEAQLVRVSDVLVRDATLHVLAEGNVVSITSDFFDARVAVEETSYARDRTTRLPGNGGEAVFVTDGGDTDLIARSAAEDDSLLMFDSDRIRTFLQSIALPPSFLAADAYRRELLFLNRSGRVELFDVDTGRSTFSYRGRGLQTAILTNRGMFLGKAADGVLDSSVLRVDPRTGETVTIDTATDLVFRLAYDSQRGRLFSIGVVNDATRGLSTVIEIFEGATFQRRQTILEIKGEYLDASVVIDPVTGNAYTTLDDRGGILRWDGTRISELARNPSHIPRRMRIVEDYLVSVNRDGTVSILDRFTGAMVLDLYMIAGLGPGAWIAVRPDGHFVVSRDAAATPRYVSVSDEHDRSLDALRLYIPERSDTSVNDSSNEPGSRFDTGIDRDDDIDTAPRFNPFGDEPAPSS